MHSPLLICMYILSFIEIYSVLLDLCSKQIKCDVQSAHCLIELPLTSDHRDSYLQISSINLYRYIIWFYLLLVTVLLCSVLLFSCIDTLYHTIKVLGMFKKVYINTAKQKKIGGREGGKPPSPMHKTTF